MNPRPVRVGRTSSAFRESTGFGGGVDAGAAVAPGVSGGLSVGVNSEVLSTSGAIITPGADL
ncbi:hypothetical protein UG55_10361 [Frankia sp. EI5c]|nr:hypothetical protein UG55_10361 [Frankia sp. EI5c]